MVGGPLILGLWAPAKLVFGFVVGGAVCSALALLALAGSSNDRFPR